jgi:hypothetical protein
MIPFMFVAAARRQRNINDIHSSHSSNSFHSSYSSHSSHGAKSNTTSHNQAGGMPLGDLEAGHRQVTYPQFTPPPSYTGTLLPSTPPPSYHGMPLPCAPAPNTLCPYVNHQTPRRPVPRPARRSRRRRCRDSWRSIRRSKCFFILCFVMVVVGFMIISTALLCGRSTAEKAKKAAQEQEQAKAQSVWRLR